MQARELLRRQREEELERKKKNEATNPSRGSPETSSRTPNEETTDSMTDGGKAPTASDQDQPASTGADESTAEEITEDHPQWKAFMKIREMVKNGSASPDEYMWCQDKHSVTLNVILPKGTLGKHVQVLLEDGWFVIVLKNREGAPFFRKKLAYPVVLEKEHAQPRYVGHSRDIFAEAFLGLGMDEMRWFLREFCILHCCAAFEFPVAMNPSPLLQSH